MAVQRGKKNRAAPAVATAAATVRGFTGSKRKVQWYGWIPDHPDQRDVSFVTPTGGKVKVVPSVDLRDQCPVIYDQSELGSCTAHAIAAALDFDMLKQDLDGAFASSRLFIYYNERVIEGTVASDAGAQLRNGIKSVASQGNCPENEWLYDISQFAVEPPQSCYDSAVKHQAITYQSVDQNLADFKACLSSGYPFLFGFSAYESLESDAVAKTGDVPLPGSDEVLIGGHAVLAVGYDDEDRLFICRNSWGDRWGDEGYFYMPYAYLLDDNLAGDFWTIRVIQ